MLGYWSMQHAKIFFIFFLSKCKHHKKKKKKRSHTHPFQNLQKAQNTDIYKN
jgi:hypothetical protein